MRKYFSRFISLLLLVSLTLSVTACGKSSVNNSTIGGENIKFDGKWIWCQAEKEQGQWAALRKSFVLMGVPEKVEAKIAVDSKYWLWINGELAVFEGGVKTGPNRSDMYYDTVDIAPFLQEGKNVITVQAVYFGKNGYGFKDSGQAGFLFNADFGDGYLETGSSIISDASWKAIKDPAYEKHYLEPNYRISEPNIKYNVAKELTDWTSLDYDDSSWDNAVEIANAGEAPFNGLWERPIPQLNVEETVIYTESGENVWKKEEVKDSVGAFTPLELGSEYTVSCEFMIEPNPISGYGELANSGSLGLTVAMQDANNFYMPQISMANLDTQKDSASYKPHIRINGEWQTPLGVIDIANAVPDNERFSAKHSLKVLVDEKGFDAEIDGNALQRVDTDLFNGGSIGFRNDGSELVRIYSLKVTSADGEEVYFKDTFQNDDLGPVMNQLKALEGSTPEIREDENDEHYLFVTDTVSMIGNVSQEKIYRYTIRNRTNIQGTPYLKVRAQEGKTIDIWTDAWYDVNGCSVRHAYVTKEGEQEWEALGWINGYDVYFDVPESVEVLELGFRPSTYNTTEAGSFACDDEEMNILYRKAYDTLLVTMRDNYMDCPNRERAQWWGDAVNEMQMAFYAMDENAGLLYKKALDQALGWKNDSDQLPTTAPNGIDAISELPMQALAGVHSFWQYYLYSGDTQPLEDGYESLFRYLKLWSTDKDGLVKHRGGTWDWMDWGSNSDGAVIEQCWYYIAAKSVKNIAELLNKPNSNIRFLEKRIKAIEEEFDEHFWNAQMNAYYGNTDNGEPDDRANALAVYSGLASKERFNGIKDVLTSTYNASPYMEKYVLEALYMMDMGREAISRIKFRYGDMIEDEYPTLWEFWDKSQGTANHAWSGGPLTMMYMFNAGITPLTAAYETFQVRPQLSGLKEVTASISTPNGQIEVNISDLDNSFTLSVSVPEGCTSADIYIPCPTDSACQIMMNGSVIYNDGNATLPDGVTIKGESDGYIAFTVCSGEYVFTVS